jgi:hypothetical protein
MAVCGWSYEQTVRTPFFIALSVMHKRQKAERQKELSAMNLARIVGTWIIFPHVKRGAKVTPQSLLPIPEIDGQKKQTSSRMQEKIAELRAKGLVK